MLLPRTSISPRWLSSPPLSKPIPISVFPSHFSFLSFVSREGNQENGKMKSNGWQCHLFRHLLLHFPFISFIIIFVVVVEGLFYLTCSSSSLDFFPSSFRLSPLSYFPLSLSLSLFTPPSSSSSHPLFLLIPVATDVADVGDNPIRLHSHPFNH